MEFNKKLIDLRKRQGLTQEELAGALFVSRTAISKWESGRGYPNIESLKALAKYFGVTIDDLLSDDELKNIGEKDAENADNRFGNFIFGLLDCSALMLLFLPVFGQKSGQAVQNVSLLKFSGIAPYLRVICLAVVSGIIASGIFMLALHNSKNICRIRTGKQISLILNAAGTILFTICRQPYPSVLLFIFLMIKAIMLIKRQ